MAFHMVWRGFWALSNPLQRCSPPPKKKTRSHGRRWSSMLAELLRNFMSPAAQSMFL